MEPLPEGAQFTRHRTVFRREAKKNAHWQTGQQALVG